MGRSVHVYDYADVVYVNAMHPKSFYFSPGPPYLRVAKGDGAAAIGPAVRAALDASTTPDPLPPNPFPEWSGARSMSAFSKRSKMVGVEFLGDQIVVQPWATDRKGNSEPLEDQQMELSAAASDEDLGGAVLDALERSTMPPIR